MASFLQTESSRPRSRLRFWFIVVSIVGHAAVGIGVFASGVWDIERLGIDKRPLSTLAVLGPPPAAAGGGGMKLPEQKLEAKPQRRIVKEPVQPTRRIDKDPSSSSTLTPGEGSGSGSGSGKGSGDDPLSDCTEDCGSGGGGSGSAKPEVKPVDEPPVMLTPGDMTMLRISGETQIRPPTTTKNTMLHDGKTRVTAVLKVCTSELGTVSSVQVLASSKYPEYDNELVSAVRGWKYRPYAKAGRSVKVCGAVTFIYQQTAH
ncbi:MAG TPA: energy transducer TonB [Kofleriaceae bacterium]|nr:energy transducer TonB [Kofleriaceae bacterium]